MSTAERHALSREVIALTALRLTDEVGLSGLSMRKLGAELGVEAMSLYHYVDNKDDLLDAVLDQLYAEIDLPRQIADDQWDDAIRSGLGSFHDVLLRHPAAAELFSSRPANSLRSIEVLYWAYHRFELMGLSPTDSLKAFRFAVSFVMGHAANELGVLALVQGGEGIDVTAIPDPRQQEFVRQHRAMSSAELFESGVELVIDGLRARFDLP